MDRLNGRIIWFKGTFGYICPDGKKDGEADIFFHQTQIVMTNSNSYRKLDANDRVSFKIGSNHKGPMAIEVMKADFPSREMS